MDSIKGLTEQSNEGHFALKLTAFIGSDALERINLAQKRFTEEILKVDFDPAKRKEELTSGQIENLQQLLNLSKWDRMTT